MTVPILKTYPPVPVRQVPARSDDITGRNSSRSAALCGNMPNGGSRAPKGMAAGPAGPAGRFPNGSEQGELPRSRGVAPAGARAQGAVAEARAGPPDAVLVR